MIDTLINKTYLGKYQSLDYISKGAFGFVYKGKHIRTNAPVAMKFEIKTTDSNNSLLEGEYAKLKYLAGESIPKVYSYGQSKTHYILIEELLKVTLSDLLINCKGKFSLCTVCHLSIETLKIVKRIHNKHYIHRDIKPENFMLGRSLNENKLYLIDFGLSRKYYSTKKKQHLPFREGKKLTGTARYCSVYTHFGFEQSRRDDLESIGYMLLFFLNGSLPWQGLKAKSKEEHYKAIAKKKEYTPIKELCNENPSKIAYTNSI